MWWRKRNRDLEDELASHLAMAARDREQRGEDTRAARLNARREMGNVGLISEVTRDMWGWISLERFLQDLRYGWRTLLRSPGYALVALLSIALGIGANTAIFSLINAVMLRSLPVHDPASLVIVGDPARVGGLSQSTSPRTDLFSWRFYEEFRKKNTVFEDVYATGRSEHLSISLNEQGKTIDQSGLVNGRFVSGNFFSLLGVHTALGRAFNDKETSVAGAGPLVVISYSYWQRQFAGNANVVGRTLLINGSPFTVLGVTPPSFTGDIVGKPIDIWIPATMKAQANPGHDVLNDPHVDWLLLMGRLKPGITPAQARAPIHALCLRLFRELYESITPRDEFAQSIREEILVSSGARGFSRIRRDFAGPLLVLMGVVAFVLLICCVNVANLQLARAASRRREMSLRLALGAGRGRILCQLLTESLLLACGGGLLGLLFSVWAARLLVRISSQADVLPIHLLIDARTLLFTAAVTLLSGVLFGLMPALQSARSGLISRLRETRAGQSAGRFGPILVSLQVALSMTLLIGAALFVRTLQNLQNSDVGYSRAGLLLAQVDFKAAGYNGAAVSQLAHRLADAITTVPGVQAVTYSENGLFSGTDSTTDDSIEGYTARNDAERSNRSDRVGPDYFQTVGTSILFGRGITSQDVSNSAPVAVISRAMARFYFPRESPLGRHILDRENKLAYSIVGVAADVKQSDLREPAPRRFYLSFDQTRDNDPLAEMNLEIRAAANAAVFSSIRSKIKTVDPKLPILDMSSVNELIDDTLDQEKLIARLSSLFSLLALILAAIGLYGVLSFRTIRRSSEIGIRMALGAGRGSVVGMILKETALLVFGGIAAGTLIAVLLATTLHTLFFGLSAFEIVPLLAAALVISLAAALAALVPAWRAARIDPVVALRIE